MPAVESVLRKFGVIDLGVPIFFGSRDTLEVEDLTPKERGWIHQAFQTGINHIGKVSPKLRSDIEIQKPIVEMVASAFKAMCDGKEYSFPSTGDLGVSWIIPSAINWERTASQDTPCYTSYKKNSWVISMTPGTPSYLFGDGTNYFRTDRREGRRFAILVFNNGILQLGAASTYIDQFRIWDEGLTKYGAYSVAPTVRLSIEDFKILHVYPTPMGAIPIFFDKGIQLEVMPAGTSGDVELPLLGMVFYEHDFLAKPRWVTSP